MNRKLIVLGALAFFTLSAATSAPALWDKPSGVKKESYGRLVKKNLELETKIDSLVKDYESFKGRHKLLMEKIKSLQYEKERLLEESRLSKFTVSAGKNEIENLKKELSEARAGLPGLKETPAKKPVEEKKYKKKVSQLEKELRAARSEAKTREKELKKAAWISEARLKEKAEREKERLEKGFKADLDAQEAIHRTRDKKIRKLSDEIEKLRSAAKKKAPEESELRALKDRVKALQAENAGIRKNLNELKKSYGSKEDDVASLNAIVRKLKAELDTQGAVSDTQDGKIKSLEKELETALASRAVAQKDLKQSIDVLGATCQELEIQNKALEEKLKAMGEENRSSAKALAKAEKTMDERLKGVLSEAEVGRRTQDEKIKSLEKELKSAVESQTAAEVKQKDAEDALKEERVVHKAQDKKIKALEKKFKSEEKKLQLKQTRAEADKKKIELKAKKLEEKSKAKKLAAELKRVKKEFADTRSELKKEIAGLKKEKSRLAVDEKYARRAQRAAERKEEQVRKRVDEVTAKLNKERLDMHYNLAVVFDKSGMYRDAEREYLKCLDLKPDDAGVYYNLGILYDDKLKKKHKAFEYYTRFLELRPMGDESMYVRDWLFKLEQENRLGMETR